MKVFKTIILILTIIVALETILIAVALLLSMLNVTDYFASLLGGLTAEGSGVVPVHLTASFIILVIFFIIIIAGWKAKIRLVSFLLCVSLIINIYVLCLCRFIHAPEVFTYNDFFESSRQFIHLLTFRIFFGN
ncbi:MAG: hypothetical protein JW969_01370 [Spirochaetales bacterium]|nr:hypothetical protein [Spirochaetales bacterium]